MGALKQLRRDSYNQLIFPLIFALFVVGLGFYFGFLPPVTPADLDKKAISELHEKQIVALRKFMLVKEFANETNRDGEEYVYSIVDSVDKESRHFYIALRLTKEEAIKLVDLAMSHPDGYLIEDQLYNGTVSEFSTKTHTYYKQALQTINPSSAHTVIDFYLEAKSGVYVPDRTVNLMISGLTILFGLCMILFPFIRISISKRLVLKTAASLSEEGNGSKYLETFEKEARKISGVYLSNDAILFNFGYRPYLMPIKNLESVCQYVFDQKLFAMQFHSISSVVFINAQKRHIPTAYKKKGYYEGILTSIRTLYPNIEVFEYCDVLDWASPQVASYKKVAMIIDKGKIDNSDICNR